MARGVCYCCKTALSLRPDGAVVSDWRHVHAGNVRDIAFTISKDGGRTFTPRQRIPTLGSPKPSHPQIAIDISGDLIVAWDEARDGDRHAGGLDVGQRRHRKSDRPRAALTSPPPFSSRCFTDAGINMIKTRSVWADRKKDDGLRILATRFRGRRLPTTQYDVWMPALGPSEQLLKAALAGKIDWKTFATRYREELYLDGPIDDRSETIKNHGQKSTLRLLKALSRKQNVTVMCHCAEDATQCHRFLLKKEIERA